MKEITPLWFSSHWDRPISLCFDGENTVRRTEKTDMVSLRSLKKMLFKNLITAA